MAAVDAAFVETGRGLDGWPDPHPDRMPLKEEYSRVTNPQKWEILTALAEAWFAALDAAGLAEIRVASVDWREPLRVTVSSTFRAAPRALGAIPLVIAWNPTKEVDWPGVVLGVGDPAEVVAIIPDCACDACDSGSQNALDQLDESVLSVVTGDYRKLWRGRREITVYSKDHWGLSGFNRRRVNPWRLLPGRFVGIPTAATPTMATTSYYTLRTSDNQGKLKWLFAARRAVVERLVNGGSRKKVDKKVKELLAHPKGWHQLHGSPWIGSDNQQ